MSGRRGGGGGGRRGGGSGEFRQVQQPYPGGAPSGGRGGGGRGDFRPEQQPYPGGAPSGGGRGGGGRGDFYGEQQAYPGGAPSRGRGGGRGDFQREQQQAYPSEGPSGGRGGGRGDFQREQLAYPSEGPSGGRRGGRGGGRGGRGRSGGEAFTQPGPSQAIPSHQMAPYPARAAALPPAPADLPSSSSSAEPASSLVGEIEQKLTISETPAQAAPPAPAEMAIPTPPPASSKALRHPTRPGFGTIGRKMLVRANHFLVSVSEKNDLCHYDVSITPEVTSRAINRAILKELVALYGNSHLAKLKPAYDGRKSLYTARELPFTSKDFVVKLPDKDKTSSRPEKEYRVAIKFAARHDLHHLTQFLKGLQLDAPQETIQVLDVVLRESPSSNYTTVARSFFSAKLGHVEDIGEGMECWRGYYQSLRPTQMGLSLNIDISATSFYKAVPVIEFIAEYLNLRDTSRPLSDNDRIRVRKALRGIRVEVTHMKGFVRRYRIAGLTPVPLAQLTFPMDDQATRISVVQYFREKYNYHLRQVNWPCLQSGSDSRPTYLPMEVCKVVEGQRFAKKLSDRQVTAILRATCKRPHEREASISKMVVENNYSKDVFARDFGIEVVNQLAQVQARVLPPPRLKYHETGREKTCNPSVGQWNMINKRMVNGGTVETWTCLNLSRLRPDAVHQFYQDLVSMCNNIGMRFNPTPLITPRGCHPSNIEAALKDIHNQSIEALARQGMKEKYLQLLVIVLPETSGSYGRIKRICETELGIVTQCCLPKNIAKSNNKQYLENVSLKINVKVGGRNTVLEDALRPNAIPNLNDKPTIIFGADVTHPPPGDDFSSSIAAVVASMDWPEVTKYRGLVSAQSRGDEMIQDLFTEIHDPNKGIVYGGMIRELLLSFYRSTGQKPHRILFYRDGVSEGQFSHVLLNEMDKIRKACTSLQNEYVPPITFVVVQKRHHTRLFPAVHGRDTDRSGNILPGTVVDTSICHPTEFDFYLCSHAGIQGTSRPTHYHVLFDENKFSADQLQTLTNNLCYTYARCTRSVSVVPPAYYAHLAAFRARYYTEGESDGESLSTGRGNTVQRTAVVRPLPSIKDNVKEVMFYC